MAETVWMETPCVRGDLRMKFGGKTAFCKLIQHLEILVSVRN